MKAITTVLLITILNSAPTSPQPVQVDSSIVAMDIKKKKKKGKRVSKKGKKKKKGFFSKFKGAK
tara:strand:+ start:289 stop:480 length:192 start_codon:yes stop_codon:yes gene_type:complete